MQSQYQRYRYADISKYAIARNNQKIRDMAQWLKDNGRTVLLYNTDGIWFTGEAFPKEMQSNELGAFKQDHTNCKFRAKSDGAYEFIEDGVYYPVIRGKTKLDNTKARIAWQWGDIYQQDAEQIQKYNVTLVPTIILLNSQGQQIKRIEGAVSKEEMDKCLQGLN